MIVFVYHDAFAKKKHAYSQLCKLVVSGPECPDHQYFCKRLKPTEISWFQLVSVGFSPFSQPVFRSCISVVPGYVSQKVPAPFQSVQAVQSLQISVLKPLSGIICALSMIQTLNILRTDYINKCHITAKPSRQFLSGPFCHKQKQPMVHTKMELSHTHKQKSQVGFCFTVTSGCSPSSCAPPLSMQIPPPSS